MDRIQGPTATIDNKFTEGNPSGGIPATIVTGKWANDVQEELCNAIEGAGIVLDPEDDTQLLQALNILAAFTPKGSFIVTEKDTPGLGVEIGVGYLTDGIAVTKVNAQTTSNVTAPVTNPRYDLLVVDAVTGAYSWITGSENVSPSIPALTAGKIPLAAVLLQTSTTAITNNMIFDLRAVPTTGGPFGLQTDIASAGTVDLSTISGRFANITGSTGPITNFGSSLRSGALYITRFASTPTMNNGASLATLTGGNITAAAGDVVLWRATSASAMAMIAYWKADGKALVNPAASTSAQGIVELATDAEAIAQASASVVLTPSNLAGMKYTSSDLTFATGGTGTITHNLGTTSVRPEAYLVCQTAEYGFSIGDVIGPIFANFNDVSADRGFQWRATSSNAIDYKYASSGPFSIPRFDNGNGAIITPANWRIRYVVRPV